MLPERRPSFARAFPREPALDAVVSAFERGDFARVRAEGGTLAASAPDPQVREAAKLLVERTKPEPLATGLLALAAALLVVLSAYWIVHGKPPAEPHPTRPADSTAPTPRTR